MPNQVFKVGDVVRLTITDKDAEDGQWFETTVTGTSSRRDVLLNMAGCTICFTTCMGEGSGDDRTIEQGARFELDIQSFCFHSGSDGADTHEIDDYDRRWDVFKATLELVVPEVPKALGGVGIEGHKTPLDILHDAANEV